MSNPAKTCKLIDYWEIPETKFEIKVTRFSNNTMKRLFFKLRLFDKFPIKKIP